MYRVEQVSLRQQDGLVRGTHQERAQYVALPVLHGAGARQGPHRVHRPRELRALHD